MRTRNLLCVVGSAVVALTVNQAAPAAGVAAPAAGVAAPAAAASPLTAAGARALSTDVTQKVIVVMKDQFPGVSAGTTTLASRRSDVRRVQGPVVSELTATHAQHVLPFTTLDAVAATVSPGEQARLEANPAVAEVVPDALIRLASPQATAAQVAAGLGGGTSPLPGACAPPGQVQLDPQALQSIGADSEDPSQPTARSLGITGAGVTVAFIADGLDIDNPDLIRPDGQHVFVDYKDFSGEGTDVPTGGGEGFLDAGSIAAQGNDVYDVSHYSALPLDQPCDIRIEGVAPGASLVGLDIFGAEDAGYASSFIQAIDYAVAVDHVNVLNESLGDNDYPDDGAALDLIKAANDAAVAAGTTVVSSSGDAGSTDTIDTPASDPLIISVGATTTYRLDAQDGYGGARFPGVTGWLDDNISSGSSGGFTQSGSTVSLVAPGELNWGLCSTDTAMYADCVDLAGDPTPVLAVGGTSESSPLTAGVAALVIQAYATTHHGADPTPAEVKEIITSTADDIGAPADQQGSGLLDAYKAVVAAEAYQEPEAAPARAPGTLLEATSQFNVVGAGSTTEQLVETVTDDGPTSQSLSLSTRAVGAYATIETAGVTLSDTTSPHVRDWQGIEDNYEPVTFIVPPGQNRLDAAIAFENASATDIAAVVRLTLVDADGDLAGYSLPQDDGNYGDVQVTDPVPGRWTAYIYSRESTDGGTTGPVEFGARVARYTTFGTVSPSRLSLAPGQSAPVTVTVTTPSTPGDSAGALVLTAGPGGSGSGGSGAGNFGAGNFGAGGFGSGTGGEGVSNVTTVPITLRSLVPSGPVSFGGVLTGGNGRGIDTGQTDYYQVDVVPGVPELNASVTLADDPDNQTYAWLVDPAGDAVAFASNGVVTASTGGALEYTNTLGANLHALAPEGGLWTIIVLFAPAVSGTALSEPFTVTVNQSAVPVSASGLPDQAGQTLRAGRSYSVDVRVTDTGTAPEAYFVDARRSSSTAYSLVSVTAPDTTVPLTVNENLPIYLVPTETSALSAEARTTGSEPIQFDFESPNGDPDLVSTTGLSVTGSYAADPVTQGLWDIAPTTVGVFGATGATSERVTTRMTATALTFDQAVTSATGDLWQAAIDPSASFGTVVVDPGQSAVIPVTITASGRSGSEVSGTLFVDDASLVDFGFLEPNGNQVAALPYAYRIGG